MRGMLPLVLAAIAALGAAAAVLAMRHTGRAALDTTDSAPDTHRPHAPTGRDQLVGRSAPLPAAAHPGAHGPDSAELLQVLKEIRDELRALRQAREGAAGSAPGLPGVPVPGKRAAAAGHAATGSGTRPDAADLDAAIRAGEALALGREIARFRHYMEMERQNEIESAKGEAPGKQADAQRIVAAYDRALQDLNAVRSFTQLMAFYHRWAKDDDVSVVYPKWDR